MVPICPKMRSYQIHVDFRPILLDLTPLSLQYLFAMFGEPFWFRSSWELIPQQFYSLMGLEP